MERRTPAAPAVVTRAVVALAAVLAAATVVTAVVRPTTLTVVDAAVAVVLGGVPSAFAVLVARHRPAERLAVVLALVGLSPPAVMLLDNLREVTSSGLARTVGAGSWVLWYVPVGLLLLLFPSGRTTTRAERVVAVLFLSDAALVSAVASASEAGTLPDAVGLAGAAVTFALLPLLVTIGVLLRRRYRRSTAADRRRIRWLALTAVALPLTLGLCWLDYLLLGTTGVGVVSGLAVLYVSVPAATALAVLREDLFDVDRATAGALTYAVVSAALVALFTALTAVGGLVAGPGSTASAVVATALCAAALAPLRRRVERLVDDRLFPARRKALAGLEAFRRDLSTGAAGPEDLDAALRRGLDDPGLRVGYVLPGSGAEVTVDGSPCDDGNGADGVPVVLAGDRIGRLAPSAAAVARSHRSVLADVAAAAAPLVEVVRLRLELRAALAEVERSRSRLVSAGDAERRRIERDLHDGAQQRLVSLGMALRLAQRHLGQGTTGDVDGLLDQAVAEISTAVAELRRIAQGLRPAALDGGLVEALRSLVGQLPASVEVRVVVERAPSLPLAEGVETTAWFVVSEALANAVKHARASRVVVRVDAGDDTLRVSVADDGVGGATAGAGSGLTGLADRVAARGGLFHVDSPDGAGTRVEAVLPCGS